MKDSLMRDIFMETRVVKMEWNKLQSSFELQ